MPKMRRKSALPRKSAERAAARSAGGRNGEGLGSGEDLLGPLQGRQPNVQQIGFRPETDLKAG